MNIIKTRLKNWNYKYLRSILLILTSSSLFISLNGSIKIFFSFYLYGFLPFPPIILATFLAIYSVYSLNKITDSDEDSINAPKRFEIISGHKNLFKITTGVSYIIAVTIGLLYGWKVLLIILFPLILGIIYSIKFHPRIPRLKDIFAVKSLIVALSWTVGNTFLPVINMTGYFFVSHLLLVSIVFSFFFIKSFINTVLFDLMDVKGDKKIGTMTIPVVIGQKRTKKLVLILNSILCLLMGITIFYGLFPEMSFILIVSILLGYFYIFYFNSPKDRFKMDIFVDGEWIVLFFVNIFKFYLLEV